MSFLKKKIVLVAFGNDILGDDAVGLAAGRILKKEMEDEIETVESPGTGLDLLEILEGYDQALLLDAIQTNRHPPGTILEFSTKDFEKVVTCSPHYVGIPEVFQLAERLGIDFPTDLRILAMEVENSYCIREGLNSSVQNALPEFVERAHQVLKDQINKG
jgi:hydrogenase maturation protease